MQNPLDSIFPEHDNKVSNYKLIPVPGTDPIKYYICYKPRKTQHIILDEWENNEGAVIDYLQSNGVEIGEDCK